MDNIFSLSALIPTIYFFLDFFFADFLHHIHFFFFLGLQFHRFFSFLNFLTHIKASSFCFWVWLVTYPGLLDSRGSVFASQVPWCVLLVQWVGHWDTGTLGYYDTGDLQYWFLNSHEGYRLTLSGFDQSGNDLQIPIVNMTVNGSVQIQKFKFRKHTFLLTQIPKH